MVKKKTTKSKKGLVWSIWRLAIFQGVLAILFGLIAAFWPSTTLKVIAIVFGAILLVSGLVGFIKGIINTKYSNFWWIEIFFGLVIAWIGSFLIGNPSLSISVFMTIVGLILLSKGLADIFIASFGTYESIDSIKPSYTTVGILSFVAGLFILIWPRIMGTATMFIIGIVVIFYGLLSVAFALDCRSKLNIK
jgi:uncharacterized membrane protein HdeD (DUF308 family)